MECLIEYYFGENNLPQNMLSSTWSQAKHGLVIEHQSQVG
jgi:hypothetical protein